MCRYRSRGRKVSATAVGKPQTVKLSYTDRVTKKYVFLISNALYAQAVYKLVGMLSEEPVWTVCATRQ